MKHDEYMKMLDDRIKECEYNKKVAYRTYLAENAKLQAAIDAKLMYEILCKEGAFDD